MATDRLPWLWRGLFALSLGMVVISGSNLAVPPVSDGIAQFGRWIAVLGATATVVIAGLVLRVGRHPHELETSLGPAVMILGATAGTLGTASIRTGTPVVRAGIVAAGAASIVGGITMVITLWRSG